MKQEYFDFKTHEPKIGKQVEFETLNGNILKGEYVNYKSVGRFWAMNWGYFYDEDILRWKYIV